MEYSNHSHSTDRESRLLDLALATVSIPLLFIIKLPMLIYIAIWALFLFLKKSDELSAIAIFSLFTLGSLAIFISLFGEFNFAGLSRLRLYTELVLYILILAITLQRAVGKINFYLVISPFLLLSLTLFFYDSLTMMAYVVTEVFILIWIILTHRMKSDWYESLGISVRLFAFSIPWVVLLFIFFPRISFEHASYGFRGDGTARVGHDGSMSVDDRTLTILSDKIVMEVWFEKSTPPSSSLYFRGSVLYEKRGRKWLPYNRYIYSSSRSRFANPSLYGKIGSVSVYRVSLYPTHKRWLYLLDLPIEGPRDSYINPDFETINRNLISEPVFYEATSALKYEYGEATSPKRLQKALRLDRRFDRRTIQTGEKIASQSHSAKEKADRIWRFFSDMNLTYSLKPEGVDIDNSSDSFLFDIKKGYCVHFASAFTIMARAAGIPARVVTGYKGDRKNSIDRYLVVRERDAHAWCELYIDGKWLRYDPTATASHIESGSVEVIDRGDGVSGDGAGEEIFSGVYLLYLKYKLERWLLHYSHVRQVYLLEKLRKDPLFALYFLTAIALIFSLSVSIAMRFGRPRCKNRPVCLIERLIKRMEREGIYRERGESVHSLIGRYLSRYPDDENLKEIDRIYHEILYADRDIDPSSLKRRIESFISHMKKRDRG